MSETNNWTAIFAGDVVIKNDRDNFVSDEIKKIITDAQISSCNLEAPLFSKNNQPIKKTGSNLYQIEKAAQLIKEAGFNTINLGNNHIYDYGEKALSETIEKFRSEAIVGAGMNWSEAYEPKKIAVGELSIGLLSLCESEFGALTDENSKTGGYAWINHPSVNSIIRKMNEDFDVVLIQVHAGVELVDLPLPEWRNRYKELIDLGADAVIGSHPHIVQGWETYKEKPIFYSIGNFCFDNKNSNQTLNQGIVVALDYIGSQLTNVRVIPIENKDGVVQILNNPDFDKTLQQRNEKLQSPTYHQEIDRIVLDLWNDRYKEYYLHALNGLDSSRSFTKNIKTIIKFLLGSNKIDYSMLLHNTMIESHHYAIMRAIKIINKNK